MADAPRFLSLPSACGRVCGVALGIDSIPVIQADRGEIAGARRVHILSGSLNGGESRANVWILVSRLGLEFLTKRQRDAGVEIICQLEIVVEVREQ